MQEQGKTIIVVSHDPFFEAIADNVIDLSANIKQFVKILITTYKISNCNLSAFYYYVLLLAIKGGEEV